MPNKILTPDKSLFNFNVIHKICQSYVSEPRQTYILIR